MPKTRQPIDQVQNRANPSSLAHGGASNRDTCVFEKLSLKILPIQNQLKIGLEGRFEAVGVGWAVVCVMSVQQDQSAFLALLRFSEFRIQRKQNLPPINPIGQKTKAPPADQTFLKSIHARIQRNFSISSLPVPELFQKRASIWNFPEPEPKRCRFPAYPDFGQNVAQAPFKKIFVHALSAIFQRGFEKSLSKMLGDLYV